MSAAETPDRHGDSTEQPPAGDANPAQWWIPQFGGRYRTVNSLSAGTYGQVYEALDERTFGRKVAVKVLHREYLGDEKVKARFLREATALSKLPHRHIVEITDYGEQDGLPYLVMPFLTGCDLRTYLQGTKPIPLPVTLQIAQHVALGLEAAHAKKFVHRDVKPANIWLVHDGGRFERAVLLDFGLTYGMTAGDQRFVSSGPKVVGTPAYSSPEIVSELPAGPSADVFSLGIVVYEMLCGERPFVGVNRHSLHGSILEKPHRSVQDQNPSVPGWVSKLVDRMLAKVPDARPTATEVVDRLSQPAAPPPAAPPPDPLPTDRPPPPPPADPPARFGDRYRSVKLLAEGTYAEVYEATDRDVYDRRVAIKVLQRRYMGDETVKTRFLMEAETIAKLNHPHIVQIYDIGRRDARDGLPFLVMPLLTGWDLRGYLTERGPLPLGLAVALGRQIADGLARVHARNLVHRDVKPDNIWLEHDPAGAFLGARLLDFGLIYGDMAGNHQLATSGREFRGAPAYASPEMVNEMPPGPEADIYSLGIVLYEAMCGERPFLGTSSHEVKQTILAKQHAPLRSRNPAVPAGLSELIDRMLAKLPSVRPTARQVVDALSDDITRPPPPPPPPPQDLSQQLNLTPPPAPPPPPSPVSNVFETDFGLSKSAPPAADRTYIPPQDVTVVPAFIGDYRIIRVLGRGGMGVVYEGEDEKLGRRVALKVMLPMLAADPDARTRFMREARAMAAIRHENVVTVYAINEHAGLPFIAMELLRGEPADARLVRSGALPVEDAVGIVRQAAIGLAAAHARGLIHRDVKPSNIWLESRFDGSAGRVVLLDFGLTRGPERDLASTQTGQIMGTPAYMAPEQASGERVDPRTDLFSLGGVLYELVTGQKAFRGENMFAVLMRLATEPHIPARELNPAVPAGLSALIDRMLSKNPAGRPESAEAVARELEQYILPTAPRLRTDDSKLARRAKLIETTIIPEVLIPDEEPTPAADPVPAAPSEHLCEVFICHAPADREACEYIVDQLVRDGKVPRSAIRVMDPAAGRPAPDWATEVAEARVFVVVLSRRSVLNKPVCDAVGLARGRVTDEQARATRVEWPLAMLTFRLDRVSLARTRLESPLGGTQWVNEPVTRWVDDVPKLVTEVCRALTGVPSKPSGFGWLRRKLGL